MGIEEKSTRDLMRELSVVLIKMATVRILEAQAKSLKHNKPTGAIGKAGKSVGKAARKPAGKAAGKIAGKLTEDLVAGTGRR